MNSANAFEKNEVRFVAVAPPRNVAGSAARNTAVAPQAYTRFEVVAAADTELVSESVADKAAVDKAAVDKAAVDKVAVDKAVVEKVAVDKVAADIQIDIVAGTGTGVEFAVGIVVGRNNPVSNLADNNLHCFGPYGRQSRCRRRLRPSRRQ